MKNLFVLAVAGLVATSANAAEMKWSGSAGWRYEQTKNDDGLNSKLAGKDTSSVTTKANAVRANLGVSGGWENVEYGFGVRTGGTTAINDDHVTLQNNRDLAIGIDQAWFRYLRDFGSMDLSVTVGRQKNVLAYDTNSQNLFDNDVRWNGLGWQFKFGMFGLNAAQYILGGRSQGVDGASTFTRTEATDVAATNSKFNYLLAVQPHVMWKFSDDIETMFAVGYYLWSDSSNTNALNGNPAANLNTGTPAPVGLGNSIKVHNPKQWHFLNNWTLPYNLALNLEYVMNKEVVYNAANVTGYVGTTFPKASKSAWSAGLTYGSLKKAHDFTVGYAYGSKGAAAVINAYTNEKFSADNKGHTFNVAYAIADNFHVGWKGIFLKEKEKTNPLTGIARVSPATAQSHKSNYWEVTAGVMF